MKSTKFFLGIACLISVMGALKHLIVMAQVWANARVARDLGLTSVQHEALIHDLIKRHIMDSGCYAAIAILIALALFRLRNVV